MRVINLDRKIVKAGLLYLTIGMEIAVSINEL
jgi:hypothetical protein